MQHPPRFKDANFVLSHFLPRIAVACPGCEGQAEVETDLKTYQSRLRCGHCHFHREKKLYWYLLSLKAYCPHCTYRISLSTSVQEKQEHIRIRCPECGKAEEYQPKYMEVRGYATYKNAHDPFMGLPLWYQAPFKGAVLWAYNREHLQYLEDYVAARLRERNNRQFATMVEKLPPFIKAAKNRDSLLKLLARLKAKG